ncbi:Regulator of chromosome condensation 1/beta-lactamase-inhibitor protein II [Arabidopsis suecica]|uniref:Regulator of chromosome condensation 1/beta-lactamase-inhibitor protein II n=1 Tax=Arabidopsis suecica TaxID=45249 RepID=A0A8T2B1I7_ARASU|nr:Regulator of chromosome condensation 1/beta-lactamase-inhibitor protein II [Arabidopsis suecica]
MSASLARLPCNTIKNLSLDEILTQDQFLEILELFDGLTNPSPGISPYMKLDEISSVTRELILRTSLRMLELTEPEKTRECRFRSITSLVGERVLHLTSCSCSYLSLASMSTFQGDYCCGVVIGVLSQKFYLVLWTRERYLWNEEDEEQEEVSEKTTFFSDRGSAKIVAVSAASAANKHTAVVSECGEVFTWGCNKEGQIGYGTSNSASNYSPRLVDYLKGKVFTAITSSKYHTLVLRDDGEDGKTMLDMTMISGFPKESDFGLLWQKKDNPPDSPRSKKIATAANKKKNRKGGLSMFLTGALDDIPKPVVAPPPKPKIEGPVWGGAKVSKGLSSLRDIQDEQSKTQPHEPVRTTRSGDDSSSKTEGKILLSSFLTSKPISMEPAKSLQQSDVEKGTPPWASSETPRNLSRPSLRDIQMQEVKKQQSLSHSPKTKTSGFTVAIGQGSPSDSPGTNRWFKPEIDAPSAIRSIQIEEKAMKDLRRFYSSVKVVRNQP